ncbi:hypothetical protein UXU46_00830 (plasmid) [Campylobacter jejuni]
MKGLSNVGVETAKEIQQRFSDIECIIPKISDQEAGQIGVSDFNDIFLNKGLDEVQKTIKFLLIFITSLKLLNLWGKHNLKKR